MAYGAIIGALLGAGSSIYGQSQQQKMQEQAQAFQANPENRTTYNSSGVASWLVPFQQAYLQRVYNDSSRPYQPFPGLYQQMAGDIKKSQEPQARPWDTLGDPRVNVPDQLAYRVRTQGMGYNPLTARPGEQLPLPVSSQEFARYINDLLQGKELKMIGGQELKDWKKNNNKMKKYMDAPLQATPAKYAGLLSNQVAGMQQAQQPSVFDQYYAKGIFGG